MPKPYLQQIDDALEGMAYGTLAPTQDVYDREVFQAAQDEYEEAQKLLELSMHPAFPKLIQKLKQNADEKAQHQRDYRGVDPVEKEKRNQGQRQADHALEFVQGIFSNAREIPRPILKKHP